MKTSLEVIEKVHRNAEHCIYVPNFGGILGQNDDVIIPHNGFSTAGALVPHGHGAFDVRDKNDVTFLVAEEWLLAQLPGILFAIIRLSFQGNGRVENGRGASRAFHVESHEVDRGTSTVARNRFVDIGRLAIAS